MTFKNLALNDTEKENPKTISNGAKMKHELKSKTIVRPTE